MENYSLLDNILEMSEQTLNITQNEALCVFGVKLVTRLSASNEDALFQSSIAKHHENLFFYIGSSSYSLLETEMVLFVYLKLPKIPPTSLPKAYLRKSFLDNDELKFTPHFLHCTLKDIYLKLLNGLWNVPYRHYDKARYRFNLIYEFSTSNMQISSKQLQRNHLFFSCYGRKTLRWSLACCWQG